MERFARENLKVKAQTRQNSFGYIDQYAWRK